MSDYDLERDKDGHVTRMLWLGQRTKLRKPLTLGLTVPPWGRIAAVLWTGGERYYHLLDKQGTVSMMPADVIEAAADAKAKP